ncbi:UvrD-helicase domain-containing protein [Cellulomonas marina]|uniref:UvrD/REP helicase N-terminal domain-containing protein n=1 Tax=Cellulomonas marina TaxID=988821 RepID=A0A1I0Y680_9CELL|nr:UvrD-helicase domain-containing protein [Cellulomonas marina]GIG29818.1 hypothetical protein Cma02nite_24180 [Cellulomonas marina]SFB08742.1 UvrD/REP helicase N-terminal domain-containing protein [Cellulomonas marina]
MSTDAPELDLSQRAAVEIEAGERQVVVAGPGSGKTEVVSALVARLVDEMLQAGGEPQHSLLVVSFSRAAVHAVNRRLRAAGIGSSAAVRTLDSLAQQIVLDAYGEQITGRDLFDRRVSRAIDALREKVWEGIDDLEHVVVDEVQDVVGVRAELLLALLDALPPHAGFSLLGDPAQAIYDFQLTADHPTSSTDLLQEVFDRHGPERRSLTGTYRAATRDTAAAVALRGAGQDESLAGAEHAVGDFAEALVPVEQHEVVALAREYLGRFAILTATNGQALMEAHDLWDAGVPAVLRRQSAAQVVDRWVAEVLTQRTTWDLDALEVAVGDERLAAERWRGIREWTRGRTVETREISRRLRSGPVPAELLAVEPDLPVVSTVHRAKGLEFDAVVTTEYERFREEDESRSESTRATYVALTRARIRLNRIRRKRYPQVLSKDAASGRWRRSFRSRKQVKAVEIRGDDLDRTIPPGADVAHAQQHLRDRVGPGDPVRLVHDWTSGDVPHWRVMHDEVEIGRTAERFGADLRRQLWGGLDRDLRGAHVECVETVAGEPAAGSADDDGSGRLGLWLGVRLTGFVVRDYKDESKGEDEA